MTNAGTPKAGQKLLSQLQRAAGGILRVISDEPLNAETSRLRITMADERTLTLARKHLADESPLTLPLNIDGYLSPYTLLLLDTIFELHTSYPRIPLTIVYEIASAYLASGGGLGLTIVVIYDI